MIPYELAYTTPLCGSCETNSLSQGGGTIEKVTYYVDGLSAIQILLERDSDPPLEGTICKGVRYVFITGMHTDP